MALEKVHMHRCALSFVTAAYEKAGLTPRYLRVAHLNTFERHILIFCPRWRGIKGEDVSESPPPSAMRPPPPAEDNRDRKESLWILNRKY
jgi:hypothetical protein